MPLQSVTKKETDPLEALREVRSILDKRARNLEKKRNKLETYKAKYDKGEKLNEDQTKAVERIDSVQKQIEIVIELHGNISNAVDVCEKSNKKKEKRDRYEKERQDANNFSKLAEIQSLLQELGDESVRELFAKGESGAILLSEIELSVMDELFKMLNPTRDVGETGAAFADRVRQTGDFVVSLLDGKDRPSNIGKAESKEGENGDDSASSSFSYKDLKELVEKILECEYFTSARIVSSDGDVEDVEEFVANVDEPTVETAVDGEATNGDLVNGGVEEVAAPISDLREAESEDVAANGSVDAEEDVAPAPTRSHASWSEVAAGAEDKKQSGLADMIDHLQSSYTFVVDSRLDSPPSAPPAPVTQTPPAPIAPTHQQQPQLTVPQQTAPKGLAATSAPIPVPPKKSNWADDVEFATSGSWVDEPLPTFNDAHSPAAAPVPPPSAPAAAPAPAAPEVDVFASASQSAYLQSGGDEGEDEGGSWQQQHARSSGHRGSGGRGSFRRDRDSRGGGAPRGFRGSRGGGNFRGGRGGSNWNERSTSGGDRGWGRGNYRGGGNFRGGNNFRGGYRGGGGNVGEFERSNATAAAAGGNF